MNADNDAPSPDRPCGILARDDGATIAYRALPGRSPTVVFLHGLKSDMDGGKALALEAHCHRRGNAFLRFDTFGHGRSSGDFVAGTIGRWAEDAVAVLDALTRGPVVLVGSSCGGWLMLLAALRRPERVAGLIGLAAAPDFTQELIWDCFSDEQRRTLLAEGQVVLPSCYDDGGYPIGRALIEEGRQHLLLGDDIAIRCPVRLIHGMRDADVPWRTSLRLAERLAAEDVAITLVKDGDHRLSRPEDLARLTETLDDLLAGLGDHEHQGRRAPPS